MACQNCKKIRDALLHGKMAEAAGLTVDKLRETFGIKVVHEDITVEGLRSNVLIDAGADHRKEAKKATVTPKADPTPAKLAKDK